MTPPTFDPTRHHAGLGVDADDLLGLTFAGQYVRRPLTPYFAKPDRIGVDALIGTTRYSTWTQEDYTGGEFQYDWRDGDVAMFSDCQGMLPDQLAKSLRGCRPVVPEAVGVVDGNITPLDVDVVNDFIYVVYRSISDKHRIYRYYPNQATDRYFDIPGLASGGPPFVRSAAWNHNTGILWLGVSKDGNATCHVRAFRSREKTANDGPYEVARYVMDSVTGDPILSIRDIAFFGEMIFVVTRQDDDGDVVRLYVSGSSGNTVWTRVGRLPGQVVQSCVYNNQLYYLTRTAGGRTQISMSDGANIFPVADFPYAFRGFRMCEYAGRLYVVGAGGDLSSPLVYGELYEITGTSLRLVRTFQPESGRPVPPDKVHPVKHEGKRPHSTDFGNVTLPGGDKTDKMAADLDPETFLDDPNDAPRFRYRAHPLMRMVTVAEGLLMFQDAFTGGLVAYDFTTDAIYGGPTFPSVRRAVVWTHALPYGNHVYLWGADGAAAGGTGLYRTQARGDTSPGYTSFLSTSDFAPEPGRTKVWGDVVAITRYGRPSLLVSQDSGISWQHVTRRGIRDQGYRQETTWTLADLPATRAIRLRFAFKLSGEPEENPPEFISHTLSYLVRGDNLRLWQFTIAAVDQAEGVAYDADLDDDAPRALTEQLWDWADAATQLVFRDVDGTDHDVILSVDQHSAPVITDTHEALVSVTLNEI